MKKALMRGNPGAMLIACCLALVWLTSIVLPVALYQYFAISTPQFLGKVFTSAWSAFFAPLAVIRWTPALSSVDPLVALIPSFAVLFALWSVILYSVVFAIRRLRRTT